MSFCKHCGYMFLSESDNMCGNCGTPRGQGSNYCSNCGATITPDQNNCTMCGYFVGKAGSNPNQSQANYNYNRTQTMTADSNPLQGTAFDNNMNQNAGYPVNPNSNPYASSANVAKSRVAAGLLGIFFGGFGVHNFYLGYTNRAVLQLVLSIVGILTACIGVGALLCFGVGVWGFAEGIMILTGKVETDSKGIPLKND